MARIVGTFIALLRPGKPAGGPLVLGSDDLLLGAEALTLNGG
jgi:hypothetical protein